MSTGQRRVLVRLPNWLGDIVMAAPTVAAIAAARPEAEVVAMVKPAYLSLAALIPGVARAVPAGADRGPGSLLRSRRALRGLGVDTAVVLPRSTRAALAPWLARVPVRLGYGTRFLTHRLAGWRPLRRAHRGTWFGLLARAFGTEPGAPWLIEPPASALAMAPSFPGRRSRSRPKNISSFRTGGPAM